MKKSDEPLYSRKGVIQAGYPFYAVPITAVLKFNSSIVTAIKKTRKSFQEYTELAKEYI